jgi:hypothetical protein
MTEQIGRPANQVQPGISDIQLRFIKLRSRNAYVDPELEDFILNDVSRLLAVAVAAVRWDRARNAEVARQTAEQLHASVRSL